MGPNFATLRSMSSPEARRTGDPRARAAQTKRDRTRRALLDAAEATFGSRGWARTRVEDIAAAAGVSVATAYNHFPTKHTLIGQVYEPLVHPLLVQAERDLAAGRPVVAALMDQVSALSRICRRHRVLTAAFCSAVQDYTSRVEGPPDADDDMDPRTLAPMPEPIRILIEDGQRTGALRGYPTAAELSGLVVNLLLLRVVNRPFEPPEVTAELLLTVLFGTLRPDLLVAPAAGDRPFRQER